MDYDPCQILNYPDMIVLPMVMHWAVVRARLDDRGRAPMEPPSPGWVGFRTPAAGGLGEHVTPERAELERRWQAAMADAANVGSSPSETRIITAWNDRFYYHWTVLEETYAVACSNEQKWFESEDIDRIDDILLEMRHMLEDNIARLERARGKPEDDSDGE